MKKKLYMIWVILCCICGSANAASGTFYTSVSNEGGTSLWVDRAFYNSWDNPGWSWGNSNWNVFDGSVSVKEILPMSTIGQTGGNTVTAFSGSQKFQIYRTAIPSNPVMKITTGVGYSEADVKISVECLYHTDRSIFVPLDSGTYFTRVLLLPNNSNGLYDVAVIVSGYDTGNGNKIATNEDINLFFVNNLYFLKSLSVKSVKYIRGCF